MVPSATNTHKSTVKLKSVGSLQGKKPSEKCTVLIREKLGEVEIGLKDMPPKSLRNPT